MDSLPPPDPSDELFDVLTSDGQPTGIVKPRATVHRDGDWHRAFHLWIALRAVDSDEVDTVLLQQRAVGKDTWPGRLDVAVGGHYRSGETLRDVVREIDEELGISPALDTLIPLGTRRSVHKTARWVDREIQDIFLLVLSTSALPALRPEPAEISALYQIPADDLAALSTGVTGPVHARRRLVRADRALGPDEPAVVTLGDLVPAPDGYWGFGADAARRVLAGQAPPRRWLGG